jgi:DNA-directed RNA polymerase specialized sigma24 family protein
VSRLDAPEAWTVRVGLNLVGSVIVARFFLGYDVTTTAKMLGCAEGTVKATTHQAINRLRPLGLVEDEEVPVR